jgi:ankyrin repeat/BTB/POZ domain-containing protein 1
LNACLGSLLPKTTESTSPSPDIAANLARLDLSHSDDPSAAGRADNEIADVTLRPDDDFADVILIAGSKQFRAHQVVLAARSEYFKARLSRTEGFSEGLVANPDRGNSLPVLTLSDVSPEALGTILEYMYTDRVTSVDPGLVVEVLDAASQFLLFPLKKAVADALLPLLERASLEDMCQWLMVADM